MSADGDGTTWDCDKCTFVNSIDDLTCVMCFQVRSSTRALPYTWQWQPQDWIPYDGPSNEQLEKAYQSGEALCNLSKGWFEAKKGEYTVHFGRKPAGKGKGPAVAGAGAGAGAGGRKGGRGAASADEDDGSSGSDAAAAGGATVASFTQVNNHTRNVRKVRRLANDDSDMFVTIVPSLVPRGDKCSICSEEWWPFEEEEEEGVAAAAPGSAAAVAAPASASAAPASASASTAASKPAAESCLALHPSDTWPDSAGSAVKLAKCAPGHTFHRECIASWIKLKDACPYCAKKI